MARRPSISALRRQLRRRLLRAPMYDVLRTAYEFRSLALVTLFTKDHQSIDDLLRHSDLAGPITPRHFEQLLRDQLTRKR